MNDSETLLCGIGRRGIGRQGGGWIDRRRGGAVLIIALLIVIVLTSLALVFARSMRVEALASANRLASVQARAIALGAAQAVLALGDELPADAVPLGDGAFWLLHPNFEDDRTYAFGITDESAKVNINTASQELLLGLPYMDESLVGAILDWRDEDTEPSPNGAENEYYLMLEDSYQAKNEAFESVEELLLVRDFTALELYGEDKNRNGVLDDNENDASDSEPPDNRDGKLDRGLYDYITVYSSEKTDGLINVNGDQGGEEGGGDAPGGGGGGGGAPGGGRGGGGGSAGGGSGGGGDEEIRTALQEAADQGDLNAKRVDEIYESIIAGRPFSNMVDFFYKSQMTVEEFDAVHERFTTSSGDQKKSLININSAPREVLMAIPGMEEADADSLIGYRLSVGGPITGGAASDEDLGTGEIESVAWISKVLDREKAVAIGDYITSQNYQRSVDIVAVSGNGKAFERYRMVYDTSGSEPKILLWQRLTHLGWPLDPEILEELRRGTPVSDLTRTTDRGSF